MRLALKNHRQTCLWQQNLNGHIRHGADRISTLEHTSNVLSAVVALDIYAIN
jgi:hypothetical protein